MYNWIISLYTRNQPNTANQLYLERKRLCWVTKSHLILSTPFKVRLPRESAERPGLRCHRSNAIRTWWREAFKGGRRLGRWEAAVGVSHGAGRRVVSWGLKFVAPLPTSLQTVRLAQSETLLSNWQSVLLFYEVYSSCLTNICQIELMNLSLINWINHHLISVIQELEIHGHVYFVS